MKHPNKIPRIQRLLSLPLERNRNCEEPVKGQARWRGSLRSPLTEPSQFRSNPPIWKRKKNDRSNNTPQSFEVSRGTPEYCAVFSSSRSNGNTYQSEAAFGWRFIKTHMTCNSSSAIDRVYDAVDGALFALQLPR
jgi:hypothetical protein